MYIALVGSGGRRGAPVLRVAVRHADAVRHAHDRLSRQRAHVSHTPILQYHCGLRTHRPCLVCCSIHQCPQHGLAVRSMRSLRACATACAGRQPVRFGRMRFSVDSRCASHSVPLCPPATPAEYARLHGVRCMCLAALSGRLLTALLGLPTTVSIALHAASGRAARGC
jgi:hypothetical protein